MYVITKGTKKLPLFWGPDGWQGNSDLATRYKTQKAAWNAARIVDVASDRGVLVLEVPEKR